MRKNKTSILIILLYVCMISNPSFAGGTANDPDVDARPGSDSGEEEECGFFCSVGEFLEGLFD